MSQSRANFRTMGNGSFRGAQGTPIQQPAPQQQQFGYQNQREEEPVVAWMNIMVTGRNGEKKKLGKGIPLRESNQLERAILDLFMDHEGNPLDFDPEILKKAISLDVRPAGQPDAEFEIDLFGFSAESHEDEIQTNANESVEQAPEAEPQPAKATTTRNTRPTKRLVQGK